MMVLVTRVLLPARSFCLQHTPEIIFGDSVVWVQPQGGAQVDFRSLQVPLVHVHEAQIPLRQITVWIEVLYRLEFRLGRLIASAIQPNDAEVEVWLVVAGIEFNRAAEMLNRFIAFSKGGPG